MIKIFVFACLNALAKGTQVADVVLSCSFIEEGGAMTGSYFTHTPATLVLKDLPMDSDLLSETITPFIPSETPSSDDLIFEVSASSVEIPKAETLLHADCNEQEVVCELSRYTPKGSKQDSLTAYFIGSIHMQGGSVSHTLVLQTTVTEQSESMTESLMQSKLQLPLSKWGTLMTEAVYVVFTRSPSIAASIGEDVILDCGYSLSDIFTEPKVELEWRWQHKGHGRTIVHIKAIELDAETGNPAVKVEREGASANSTLLVTEGNASLTMKRLKVSDEGTYICTVGSGPFQTQQIIQLHIIQPPRVFTPENEVIFQDDSPQKLSCHTERYYPLDVKVEWFSQPPGETASVSLTEKAFVSSHRQHSDGTFSLSSFLIIRPSESPPGTVLTCRVSHLALQSPSEISLTVLPPKPANGYYWMIFVTMVMSLVFLYQAIRY